MTLAKTIDEHLASGLNDIQPRLRRKWWKAVGVYLAIYRGCFSLLYFVRPHHHASQWFLQTAVVAAYVLFLLRIALPLNYHPQQKVVYSTIGLATWITVLRGMLIAMLAGYLFQPWSQADIAPVQRSWAPGAIYIMAAGLDYVDGVVARVRNHATRLGEFLDVNIDALGLLVAPLLAVCYSQLPLAYLSVSVAYYLLNMGIWLRKKYSLPQGYYGYHLLNNLSRGFNSDMMTSSYDLLLQDELNHPSLFRMNHRLRKKADFPIVAIVHQVLCRQPRNVMLNRIYETIETRYLNSVDAFIFNSHTTRQTDEKLIGGRRGMLLFVGDCNLPSLRPAIEKEVKC